MTSIQKAVLGMLVMLVIGGLLLGMTLFQLSLKNERIERLTNLSKLCGAAVAAHKLLLRAEKANCIIMLEDEMEELSKDIRTPALDRMIEELKKGVVK